MIKRVLTGLLALLIVGSTGIFANIQIGTGYALETEEELLEEEELVEEEEPILEEEPPAEEL